jgi:2'-hydroxyisoflavone reductase
MRLLVLGGTVFLGRHVVEAALARGHDVSLFHRGRQARGLYPEAEEILGDRDGGLGALDGREWDAVIDTSGRDSRLVRASAEALVDRVGHYTFVSSGSAYADHSRFGMDENSPTIDDPGSDDYGAQKAQCEREVLDVLGERCAIVRPGLIVGPYDPTDRFDWWVRRIAAGGKVVAPEPRDQPVQVIDARDLAEWMVRLDRGTFGAVGDVMTMEQFLERLIAACGSDVELDWTPEEQLLAQGVEPWDDMPLWLGPSKYPEFAGFMAVSNARAVAARLRFRPIEDTVRDVRGT